MDRQTYRKTMVDLFVDSLKQHSAEKWQRPWATNAPYNGKSGRYYSGSNAFFLRFLAAERGYKDPRWFTYNQIAAAGYQLQNARGQGVPVEYWYPYDPEERKKLSWKQYDELLKNGDPRFRKLILRNTVNHVFNAELIKGVPELEIKQHENISLDSLVSKIAKNMNVEILNDGIDRAFYRPSEDKIHLPEANRFNSAADYNLTALHELSHATGHANRLDRKLVNVYDEQNYAYEELIAEISVTFMAEYIPEGVSQFHMRNHVAYVDSWIEHIEKNPEVLFKAIGSAERAANYLEYKGELIALEDYEKTLKTMRTAKADSNGVVKVVEDHQNFVEDPNLAASHTVNTSTSSVQKEVVQLSEQPKINRTALDDALSYSFNSTERAVKAFIADNKSDQVAMGIIDAGDSNMILVEMYPLNVMGETIVGRDLYLNDELLYSSNKSRLPACRTMVESIEQLKEKLPEFRFNALTQEQRSVDDPRLSVADWRTQTDDLSSNGNLIFDEKDIEKIVENHAADLEKLEAEGVKETLIINAFGGPGAGKTTACMAICSELKKQGFHAEYVQEYAKDLVYENNTQLLDGSLQSQYKILREQMHRQDRLIGKVDFIVTDAPILLNDVYLQDKNPAYQNMLKQLYEQYHNFNFFVERNRDPKVFQKEGRIHDYKQSIQKDNEIKAMLKGHKLYFGSYDYDHLSQVTKNAGTTFRKLNAPKSEVPKTFSEFKNKRKDQLTIIKDSIDIKEYARNELGLNLTKIGRYYGIAEYDSVRIYENNTFTRYSNRHGGSIIDFIAEFHPDLENLPDFPDEKHKEKRMKAIEIAKVYYNETHPDRMNVYTNVNAKPNILKSAWDLRQDKYKAYLKESYYHERHPKLPDAARSNREVIKYLKEERCIHKDVIEEWINRGLIYQDNRGNMIMVGKDYDNEVKYYHAKGIRKSEDGKRFMYDSKEEESVKIGVSKDAEKTKDLYVTEAVIDAMSLECQLGGPECTQSASFLSLQSASNQSALGNWMQTHDLSSLENIYLCLDNDDTGNEEAEKMKNNIDQLVKVLGLDKERKIDVLRLMPQTKDFNDDLIRDHLAMQQQAAQAVSPSLGPEVPNPALSFGPSM